MIPQSGDEIAQQILANIKAPWTTGIAGMSIIVSAFLIAIVNASFDAPNKFIGITLQPLIFVGLGLLLYHVGQHLHVVNQNAVLMAGMNAQTSDDSM